VRHGFTLIELMVAIAIIIILTAFVIPNFGHGIARIRLRFAGMTLVQDLRQMQAEAVTESSYRTIVFVTDENRYYFREGTKSWAPTGAVSVERRLNSSAGFPLAAGKRQPVSAVFGTQSSMVSSIVTMSYNELGHPSDDSGWGHVTLVTPYGDRLDVIVTSVDGSARMEWVPH